MSTICDDESLAATLGKLEIANRVASDRLMSTWPVLTLNTYYPGPLRLAATVPQDPLEVSPKLFRVFPVNADNDFLA